MPNTSGANELKGLEGMILLKQGKIGVLSNSHQFIPYTSFNTVFSREIDAFCREYKEDPVSYKLGAFNLDSYSHLEKMDWENANLIIAGNVFKALKSFEDKLPDEIIKLEKLPVEKCMSSYMGMRMLSIFGNKIGYYPILVIEDKKPLVINFKLSSHRPDFEREVKHLILSSPLFTLCKSLEFKEGVLNYDSNDSEHG